jgi:hypothetical protein
MKKEGKLCRIFAVLPEISFIRCIFDVIAKCLEHSAGCSNEAAIEYLECGKEEDQ